MIICMSGFNYGPVGKFTIETKHFYSFEPKTPALLEVKYARAMLYQTELRALIMMKDEQV